MKEYYYDKLLNIHTRGKQAAGIFSEELYYYPYEPTPYHALEVFAKHYEVKKNDQFVDFGCGKGRFSFFLNHTFDVSSVGIEMDQLLCEAAFENRERYYTKHSDNRDVYFYRCYAEEYEIHPLDNRFYFFNPFSVQIFKKVVQNIISSLEKSNRELELILYYASEEYVSFLKKTPFVWKDEIRVPFLYHLDSSERFLIYRFDHSI